MSKKINSSFELSIGSFFDKVAVETSFLVDLCLYPKAVVFLKSRRYDHSLHMLCNLTVCISETKGVLTNSYNLSVKEADKRIDAILMKFDITRLKIKNLSMEGLAKVLELANKHGMNKEDRLIVFAFWKYKVTFVLTRDNAMKNVLKDLGIGIIQIDTFN